MSIWGAQRGWSGLRLSHHDFFDVSMLERSWNEVIDCDKIDEAEAELYYRKKIGYRREKRV